MRDASFKYGAITLFGRPFQVVLLESHVSLPDSGRSPSSSSIDTYGATASTRTSRPRRSLAGTLGSVGCCRRFGLIPFRSPLLRECADLAQSEDPYGFSD